LLFDLSIEVFNTILIIFDILFIVHVDVVSDFNVATEILLDVDVEV
jgi:hypothetical protein